MTVPFNKAFILSDPRVLGMEVHAAHVSDAHLTWSCSYSTPDLEEDHDFRVVIATLHGANDEATFTVTMGSIFVETGLADAGSDYAGYLAESEALEALYDLCRLQARTTLGMLDLEKIFQMPSKAPNAKVSMMGEEDIDDHDDVEPGVDESSAPE